MGNGYKGTFHDGVLQASFSTWSIDAENPDSNGETYNSDNWKSVLSVPKSEIEKDLGHHFEYFADLFTDIDNIDIIPASALMNILTKENMLLLRELPLPWIRRILI